MPSPGSAAAASPLRRSAVYRRALGFFVVAAGVSAVANGPHAVAFAAWLAPLFWLLALHRLPVRTGALIGGLFHGAATVVAARGMLPFGGGWYVLAAAGIGMGALFPFVVQRALAPRLPTWLIPLTLPVIATALEFLGGIWQPFGSFGAVAYTQIGALALLQLAAVTGLPGIALLLYLPASLTHWALDYRPPRAQMLKAVSGAGLLLVLVFGCGAMRLAQRNHQATVEVAVVSSPLHKKLSELLAPAYTTGDPGAVNWEKTFRQGDVVLTDLLQRTQRAAHAGARIIVWPETAGVITAETEPSLLRTAGTLTRTEGVYLAMALGVIHLPKSSAARSGGVIDNKIVLLGPTGQIVTQYRKSIPVPGPETALLVPGNGAIPIVSTPYGRIALAICFDLDFPALMRRAAGAELLLVAAEDWRGITPYHSDMARLRAIEGGYALVRATRYGRSIVADAHGQLVAARADFDDPGTADVLLRAAVPVGGTATVYPRTGDAVGWLTVGGFFILVLLALLGAPRHHVILSAERPRGAEDPRETPT